MNCFECRLPCELSNPLGYCLQEKEYDEEAVKNIEKATHEVITKQVKPIVEDALRDKRVREDCSTCSANCPLYDGCYVGNIHKSATNLVDAVERYVEPKPGQEFVHRSEILLKKNALKELLK